MNQHDWERLRGLEQVDRLTGRVKLPGSRLAAATTAAKTSRRVIATARSRSALVARMLALGPP